MLKLENENLWKIFRAMHISWKVKQSLNPLFRWLRWKRNFMKEETENESKSELDNKNMLKASAAINCASEINKMESEKCSLEIGFERRLSKFVIHVE